MGAKDWVNEPCKLSLALHHTYVVLCMRSEQYVYYVIRCTVHAQFPVTPSSDHLTMMLYRKGGNIGYAHMASVMRYRPRHRHIVARPTLNSASYTSQLHPSLHPHCFHPISHSSDQRHPNQDEHIAMLHSSTNTGMYICFPNLFPTNAPCNSLRFAPHQCVQLRFFIIYILETHILNISFFAQVYIE